MAMRRCARVLLLYMSVGSGHRTAVESIDCALQSKGFNIETTALDILELSDYKLIKSIPDLYDKLLGIAPEIYDVLWDNQKLAQALKLFDGLPGGNASRKLKQLIAEFDPSVILCTHALPCRIICRFREKGGLRVSLVAVVTDFGLHSYWPNSADKYVVAATELKLELLQQGINERAIEVCGIPINPQFAVDKNKFLLKKRLGLKVSLPVVLALAGSSAISPYQFVANQMNDLLIALNSVASIPFQVVVVTGVDEQLKNELEPFRQTLLYPMRVLGYVREMDELMKAADILISKAGGLVCAEALATELPMIILGAVFGQERANARFLTKAGVAVRADSYEIVPSILRNLLGSPSELQSMKRKARALARPNAAYDIAHMVQSLCVQYHNSS